jgi:CheY-like chemotaxis protein
LQRLRQSDHKGAAQSLKVIVVTADRLATRREELSTEGIDGYLTKPIDLQRLTGEVRRVLSETGAGGV